MWDMEPRKVARPAPGHSCALDDACLVDRSVTAAGPAPSGRG